MPLPYRTPLSVSVDAPVPPSATARSVMPVIEPPVMLTLLAFCVDIVPRPEMSVLAIVAQDGAADAPPDFIY